jgi:hypothetical protein
MKPGTNDHRKRVCRTFLESHNPWNAEQFSWPLLDITSQECLRYIPGWTDLFQKKQQLSRVVAAYATTANNALIRDAMALLGQEYQRQTSVLKKFIAAYDIPRTATTTRSANPEPETDFIQGMQRECLDSFWRFGWFGLVQHHHALPTELLDPFDRLLQEEARQLIFFVDWLSYYRARQRKRNVDLGGLPMLWRDRNKILKFISAFGLKEDVAPSPLSPFLEKSTAEEFLNLCLSENQRRMAGVEAAVPQPKLGVATAQVLREVVRLWPQRRETSTIYD